MNNIIIAIIMLILLYLGFALACKKWLWFLEDENNIEKIEYKKEE